MQAQVDDSAKLATQEMGKRIDAGAPVGAYTNLLISYEQSDRVSDDPGIKGVALTGSVAAGRNVAARAGQNLKKSTMELGGSDAFIVLDDADLDKTIPWAVWGRMYNAGQTCCAKLLMGGKRIARPGWFMQPTILTDIRPGNPAFRGEIFGPVVSFIRVKDEAAAIALANAGDFGLGGSVWTRGKARGKRVASQVDTGMMFVNNLDWVDADMPFGGIKGSGYGRELGHMGIQEFVNKKLVRTGNLAVPA